jgi:rubredoxin
MADSEKLVTVATFDISYEAHLAKARLEDEGIPALLLDENIVTMMMRYSHAVGGIKLQVRKSDAVRAKALLSMPAMGFDDDETEPLPREEGEDEKTCPACGAGDVYFERFSPGCAFASVLLLGFPLIFLRKKWRCMKCNRRFDPREMDAE